MLPPTYSSLDAIAGSLTGEALLGDRNEIGKVQQYASKGGILF